MKGFRKEIGLSRREAVAGLAAAGVTACSAQSEQPVTAAKSQQKAHPLWPIAGRPVLRGAVIAQRRRRESIDGPLGTGFAGGLAALPAYGGREFAALAEAGANLVVMSYPELWTAEPPYRRDQALADLLGRQMDEARTAGLYIVVGLRSGPGRSDFIFHRDSAGSWFPKDMIVDRIWTDREAQGAWKEMCVDAAKLVAGRSEAAGLILMVEPDANYTGRDDRGRQLGVWEPAEYARKVSDLSDWRRIAGACAGAVRSAAADLPILISPPAFARPDFLEVMGETPVEGCVWCVHDYEPRDYTHVPAASRGIVPFSEKEGVFEERMSAAQRQGAPVFLGEFGAARWADDTGAYYRARTASCEKLGVNWAAFRWPTFDAAYEAEDDTFNFVRGPDLRPRDGETPAIDVLKAAWAKNVRRP